MRNLQLKRETESGRGRESEAKQPADSKEGNQNHGDRPGAVLKVRRQVGESPPLGFGAGSTYEIVCKQYDDVVELTSTCI